MPAYIYYMWGHWELGGGVTALFEKQKRHSFRRTVPPLTLTLQYKDFGAQSRVLGLGLGSVGLVILSRV